MDPISDLFETMAITSVIHGKLEATAPWGLTRDDGVIGAAEKRSNTSSPFHYAHFGMITHGSCWLSIKGVPEPLSLVSGDCFLLAPGISYSLRDDPLTPTRSFCDVVPHGDLRVIQYGGGGARTTVISGWFQFAETSVKPMMQFLPPFIVVRADVAQSSALHTTMNMLEAEILDPVPGTELSVKRLADLLFIHCLRAYTASNSEKYKGGLLRAIFDPQIGKALGSIHEKLGDHWTVESLASVSGMSRSAFALRFKELVGKTPLEYLRNWRMQKAIALLKKGDKKLFEVAKSVGYDSDAAFSKAFKRVVGMAPMQSRRGPQTKIG